MNITKRKFDESTNHNTEVIKKPKILHISENGTLKYDLMISLENIAVAKTVSNIWMNQNTQQEVIKLFHINFNPRQSDFFDKWRQIENNVVTKISELLLANSLTKKLTNIVPLVGNSILGWIRYHDEYIFITTQDSKYSAVDQINNIKWTTRGKIDYAQTAINILANQDSCLSDDHKYKIACTYCLEDEIAVLAPNVVDQFYLDNVAIDIYPMVYFWTAHITGDNTKLLNQLYNVCDDCNNNISINEHIIQLLINNNLPVNKIFNEIPIKYMWNKLSEEEKTKNVASLFCKLCNKDWSYSLLSNLDYEQQQLVFKECSASVLDGILNDCWSWEEYFLPFALHVLDIMHPGSYLFILENVIFKLRENSQEGYVYNQYKAICKQLWQKGSKRLKDFVFEHENGRSLENIVFSFLSWKRDMDIIELIFKDLNAQQKKNIILGCEGVRHCSHLIQSDQWDLLEVFIKYNLSSKQDVAQLKQDLVRSKGRDIAEEFVELNAWDKIEYFMKWAFKSEEEVDRFRQSLAYIKCGATLKSIKDNHKVDFTELENYFKWCAKNNLEVINQFKARIPRSDFCLIFGALIEKDKYELIDQVLEWCFLGDICKIFDFKKDLFTYNLSYSIRVLCSILVRKDNPFKLLNKYIYWSLANREQFKTWLLNPQYCSCSICTDLLEERQFELADQCVYWCVDYDVVAASKFKNEFMLSRDMEFILDSACEDTQDISPQLIKWFSPSQETVQKFKTLHSEEECPNNFYKLLDECVESQNSLVVTGGKENVLQVSSDSQDYHNDGVQEELNSVDNLDLV